MAIDPYAGVDWEHDERLTTQFHEHVRNNPELIGKLDAAGYNAVGLMHYSGVASKDYTWKERHWPPEHELPADFIAGLKHIKVLFPNAEEVGFDHITSPFLTRYIAKWEPEHFERREPWHYASTQEAIDRIREFGGLAFIAHPWRHAKAYTKLQGFRAMELYNAYCRHKFEIHSTKTDQNEKLRASWDAVLQKNPAVLGVAVNDWFGVWSDDPKLKPTTRDSGKSIVLVKEVSLAGLRDAVDRGAVLAVQDFGETKGQLPRLEKIVVSTDAIELSIAKDAGAEIHWIADGKPLGSTSPRLLLSDLKPGARYVRAEISNAEGSTVFTQAFGLIWSGHKHQK